MTNLTAPVPVSVDEIWECQKEKLKSQFQTLTDEDLEYEEGKKDEMFTKLQVKLGKTKEEFEATIASL